MSATRTTQRYRKILGAERARCITDYRRRYGLGASIRQIAAATGRSYGFVHQILSEGGVRFRGQGGPRRRRPK